MKLPLPLRFAALLLIVLLAGTDLEAQAVKDLLGSNSSGSVQLSRETTLERAIASFEFFVDLRAEDELEGDVDEAWKERIEEIVERSKKRFKKEAARSLMELQKDGLLTLDESKDKLRDLADLHLAHMEESIDAARLDVEPPPFRGDYESWFDYVGDAVRYMVRVRNPPSRFVLLLVCIMAGLGVAALLAALLKKWSRTLESRRPSVAIFLASLTGPLHVIAAFTGVYIGLTWIWMPYSLEGILKRFLQISIYASVLWIAWGACGALAGLMGRLARRTNNDIDEEVVEIVRKCLRLLTLFIFLFIFAESLLDMDMKALLAGLGILGLVMTLSLQGTIKNLIASFAIHADDLFQVGHRIQFKDYFGEVEDIGFRASKIRTLDGHLVTIPNEVLIKEAVENVSKRPYIRRRFRLDLEYGTPPEKVEEAIAIVKDIISEGDWQSSERNQRVLFEELAAYSLRILVEYHFQPADYWEAKENDSRINRQLISRFHEANIPFAFPTQTIDLLPSSDAPSLNIAITEGADTSKPKRTNDGEPATSEAQPEGTTKGQDNDNAADSEEQQSENDKRD